MDPSHQNSIATLEHLLVRSNNAREAYRNAAKNVHNRPMKSFFEEAAISHEQYSEEIRQEIRNLGGTPKDKTSLASDADRFWLDFTSIIVRRNESAILKSCAEAEEKAIKEYDKLINQHNFSDTVERMLTVQRDRSQEFRHRMLELDAQYSSD